MKKIVRSVLCLLLILAMVVPFAGCKKNTEVTEMTYPGQDNMTCEELQELDRQNPITIEIYVAGMTDGYAMEVYGKIFIPEAWSVK